MSRFIQITDSKKRDGQVSFDWPKAPAPTRTVGPGGLDVKYERLVKMTERSSYDALLKKANGSTEELAKSLLAGDPEIDLEQAGRKLGEAMRVYIRPDGTILYAARTLQVVTAPDGTEKSRGEFIEVEANVAEDGPALPWTGRLLPLDEVVRKFAFTRKVQIKHVSGLTYDFLFSIAKELDQAGKLLLVGAGPKGALPLIFSRNGAPYRGFLEGRVKGDSYKLVLHLSNLELKSVHAAG